MLSKLKRQAWQLKTRCNHKLLALFALFTATLMTHQAMAITTPAANSFAYDLYDVGVNNILNGAPGFIGGLFGVVYSATKIASNWIAAVLGILGSTAVLQADNITTSLGALI